MFSYRHAFHAGNHADVLKHTVLIAALQHLTEKDAALTVLDTHAGAGLYRLDGDYASTSGEAADGVARLFAAKAQVRTLMRAVGIKQRGLTLLGAKQHQLLAKVVQGFDIANI